MHEACTEPAGHVDAVENLSEPELAWPPPPTQPSDPAIELEVGGFFGQKRRAMRRALVGGFAVATLTVATVALADGGAFEISPEPRAPRSIAGQPAGVGALP